MGRPPSNGGPSFRFNQAEIAEMEAILQAHKTAMPAREVLVSLAEKFSNSEERKGKIEVQVKQVWNWFQNRRYAIRAKAGKSPGKLHITQMTRDDSGTVKGVPQSTQLHAASSTTVRSLPQAPQHPTVPTAAVRTFPQAPQHPVAFTVQSAGRVTDNSQMEYEAKSARDGAWYDVSTFLSHRSLETGDPEVLVRFAGFGAEEDEWVNVRKNVRQRSLPCESSECVAVLPADLILCFQEGKEQALYFDAHVLDAQRRRHDVRGCRCRFLVRYDHDQSEEIVALRKICRRPETDYRLQQLHAVNESLSANHNKIGGNNVHSVSTLRVYPPAEVQPPKQHKVEPVVSSSPVEVPQKRQKVDLTVPAPQPEGSQRQFKVEPVVLAPQSDVLHQPIVQPVVPAPSPEVPQDHHKVEPVLPDSSAQQSVELQKVEPIVPVPSAQDSAELQSNTPTRSDKVPLESQKVQPVIPNPSTDVAVEPHKIETISSAEAKQEAQTTAVVPLMEASHEHHIAEPAPSGEGSKELQTVGPAVPPSSEVSPTVAAPSLEIPVELHKSKPEEPVVLGSSSVKIPTELHEVQPAVPDQPALEAVEKEAEEPMVPVPTNDRNVAEEPVVSVSTSVVEETKAKEAVVPVSTNVIEEAMEIKAEEPMVPVSTNVVEEHSVLVPANDCSVVEAGKCQHQCQQSETMDSVDENVNSNGNEDKHANIADNTSDDKVRNPDLVPENTVIAIDNVTGIDTADMEEG